MRDGTKASNSLCFFRPLTLAYVRREGALSFTVPEAWRELRKRISAFALEIGGPLASYGVFHRPHHSAADQSGSFDACIEIPPQLERAVRGSLAIQQLSGGVYIGSGTLESHRQLDAALDCLSNDPLITHGLTVDAERPVIVCYVQMRGNELPLAHDRERAVVLGQREPRCLTGWTLSQTRGTTRSSHPERQMTPNATRPFIPVRIAVLTVSDTRNRSDDKSGDTLVERIREAGHELAARDIVRDDIGTIAVKVSEWIANPQINVVITTGGTGFTGRDVTPDAVRPLFEKEIDGFSAVFHAISFQKIGTSTIQSRACAGLANETFIFCLPGSPGACRDAWDGILGQQLDNRHRPCNFVEIMPRLGEGR